MVAARDDNADAVATACLSKNKLVSVAMIRRALIRCARCSNSSVVRMNKRAVRHVFLNNSPLIPPTLFSNSHVVGSSANNYHSSLAAAQAYETPKVTVFKEYTERILRQVPVGSMQESDWQQAYPTFLWWTDQGTPEAVKTAWRLLDRLVEEEQTCQYATLHLETHWLNRLVEMSRMVTVTNEQGLLEGLAVGPMDWLERIDTYAPYLVPNVATYSMIIIALTKWSQKQPNPDLAESLIRRMHDESEHNPSVAPDVGVYNSALYAWANSGLEEAPHRAEALLKDMRNHGLEPDAISYGTLITTWSRSGDPNAAQQAENTLRKMADEDNVEPSTIVYNSTLQAWERSGQENSVQRADVLFREMLHLYEEEANDAVKPDASTFRIILRTLVYQGAVARADAVIRQMQQMYEHGELGDGPTRKQFDAVIHEWANASNPSAAERAESLLRFMYNLHVEGNKQMRPMVHNFSAVIAAWTKTKSHNAAKHAEAMLEWMQEFHQAGDDDMVPNTMMCTSIISAWSKSRDKTAPERAQALLHQMNEWYEAGNESVKPNIISYNALMKVWAKSRRPEAPERVEAIMRRMGDTNVKPDLVSYSQLMNAYANSGDPAAPERAESILRHLLERHEAGHDRMKPDLISYTTVMKAWANSKVEGAAERAESFLRYMDQVYRETGDESIKPNAVCYTMAIKAWIQSDSADAAVRAATLLEEVHDLQKSGVSDMKLKKQVYWDIMQLLATRTDVNSGQVSQRILLYMQDLADAGDAHMSPSTKFFNLTIRAWSNSGHALAAQRAESILDLMQQLPDLKPNRLTYNFVIKAWSKSGDIFAGKRAEQHLRRMQELAAAGDSDLAPNEYTYGDVGNAWKLSGHADAEKKAKKYAAMSKRMHDEKMASKAEASERNRAI